MALNTNQSISELCYGSQYVDGVGYNADPKSCSEFIQCFYEGGQIKVEKARCPFRMFWDQRLLFNCFPGAILVLRVVFCVCLIYPYLVLFLMLLFILFIVYFSEQERILSINDTLHTSTKTNNVPLQHDIDVAGRHRRSLWSQNPEKQNGTRETIK
jgi:hypothetical protein